ncbi:hypothetical protein [Saccharopolyspora rosea]|uniref:Uncharacterized protein n=1 Tax=Saccharopolyspora rosea TaxID=524884 RepID=A0ABW3FPM1_9PSEU|nr:hypothetical protein [Saccharopolyspora rosea]
MVSVEAPVDSRNTTRQAQLKSGLRFGLKENVRRSSRARKAGRSVGLSRRSRRTSNMHAAVTGANAPGIMTIQNGDSWASPSRVVRGLPRRAQAVDEQVDGHPRRHAAVEAFQESAQWRRAARCRVERVRGAFESANGIAVCGRRIPVSGDDGMLRIP